jgi:8-hydroxy-5-deazaflavin:NADPH oxidoreductase
VKTDDEGGVEMNQMRTVVDDLRRVWRRSGFAVVLCFSMVAAGLFGAVERAEAQPAAAPMRIGIIGTGRIGGALAQHWAAAGHELMISSRNPENLVALAEELGPRVQVGTPREAAAFGEVVLVSVPYSAMPQIGADFAAELAGKIVLDTGNPVANRDGDQVPEWQRMGAGVASQSLLPGTRLVRAFNCIPAATLANQANRAPERIAIPLGGDDAEALEVAQRLVSDAGFDGVVIGSLERSRVFDLGQPLPSGSMTAAEMRAAAAALP